MEQAAAPGSVSDVIIDPLAPRPFLTAIQGLLLVLLAAGCLVHTLPADFSAGSEAIVATNAKLAADMPWSAVWQVDHWGSGHPNPVFRPLALMSFRIETQILGLSPTDPTHYAIVNALLHVAAVLLLFRLAMPYLLSRQAAFLAAAMFAAHPVAAMTAPYLPARAILLMTVLALTCMLSWENFRRTAQLHWSWAAACCWILAGLSHEWAIAVGGLILARELAMEPRRYRLRGNDWLKTSIPGYLALIAGGLVWLALRAVILGKAQAAPPSVLDNVLVTAHGGSFYLTAIYLLREYILHAFVPLGLAPDYGFAHVQVIRDTAANEFRTGAAMLAGLVIAATILFEYRKAAGMGLLVFLVALLPASNLLGLTGTHLADRALYLPVAGLAMAAAAVLAWAGGWGRAGVSPWRKAPPAVLGACLVGVLAVMTFNLAAVWADDLTLWRYAVDRAPDSVRARTELARALTARDPTGEALEERLEHARAALALSADLPPMTYPEARLTLAAQHLALGRSLMQGVMVTRPAAQELRRAAALLEELVTAARQQAMLATVPTGNPTGLTDATAPRQLATIYTLLKVWPDAARAYTVLLELEPDDAQAHARLAEISLLLGRLDAAQTHLMHALRLQPDQPSWRERLAEVLVARGRFDDALMTLEGQGIDLASPEVRTILENAYIGLIQRYVAADRRGEAEEAARDAVQRHKISAEKMQQALDEAFEARRKALSGEQ